MKLSFWIQFAVSNAIQLVQAFIAGNSKLTEEQKVDLNSFIEAGTKLLSDFKH